MKKLTERDIEWGRKVATQIANSETPCAICGAIKKGESRASTITTFVKSAELGKFVKIVQTYRACDASNGSGNEIIGICPICVEKTHKIEKQLRA